MSSPEELLRSVSKLGPEQARINMAKGLYTPAERPLVEAWLETSQFSDVAARDESALRAARSAARAAWLAATAAVVSAVAAVVTFFIARSG